MENENLPQLTEFETKYRVDGDKVYEFKKLVEYLNDNYKFVYAQGPDRYYTKKDGSFMRFRKAETDKYAEITMKAKPEGAKHNIKRKEVNWKVDYNLDVHEIDHGAEMLGYDFNFEIWKMCHIYKFKDATLVFYTVRDEKGKVDHFIEIELDEKSIHKLTEKEAWEKIRHYEGVLAPVGIVHNKRLTKSLYEMYVKDIYEVNTQESKDSGEAKAQGNS